MFLWPGTEQRFAARTMIGKILSGRTKDQNIGYIAEYLTALGVDLKGRIGEPEDIANAAVFLASPGWITAQMLTVDGGRMDYI